MTTYETYKTDQNRYRVGVESFETGKSSWNYLLVRIATKTQDEWLLTAAYVRHYHALYETFLPFTQTIDEGDTEKQRQQDYALFSADYTTTAVMELPGGRWVASEPRASNGFCPTEFYVYDKGRQGLVAGCVWGDDSTWKVQHLDLSRISEGILMRTEKFGYAWLQRDKGLADSVSKDRYITLATEANVDDNEDLVDTKVGDFDLWE